jgi:hypothetical protein
MTRQVAQFANRDGERTYRPLYQLLITLTP